jgi:hypothetical protein
VNRTTAAGSGVLAPHTASITAASVDRPSPVLCRTGAMGFFGGRGADGVTDGMILGALRTVKERPLAHGPDALGAGLYRA